MIAITLFGQAATIHAGEWTFANGTNHDPLADYALAVYLDRSAYHPDPDMAQVDALVAAWGTDAVVIQGRDDPEGGGEDTEQRIY